MDKGPVPSGLEGFTEADVRSTLLRALRLLGVLTVVGTADGACFDWILPQAGRNGCGALC